MKAVEVSLSLGFVLVFLFDGHDHVLLLARGYHPDHHPNDQKEPEDM